IVPTTGVQSRRVFTQLVKNLIHLECCGNRFNEYRCPDCSLRESKRIFGCRENFVPQPGFFVRFKFWQIEEWALVSFSQGCCVVEAEQPKVEKGSAYRFTSNEKVRLIEMPASWAYREHGDLMVESIFFALRRAKCYRATYSIFQVDVSFDKISPGRRGRILKVGHVDIRTGVECIDDHFSIYGPRDLYTTILQSSRYRFYSPILFANWFGRWQKVGKLAGIDFVLALFASFEQL